MHLYSRTVNGWILQIAATESHINCNHIPHCLAVFSLLITENGIGNRLSAQCKMSTKDWRPKDTVVELPVCLFIGGAPGVPKNVKQFRGGWLQPSECNFIHGKCTSYQKKWPDLAWLRLRWYNQDFITKLYRNTQKTQALLILE